MSSNFAKKKKKKKTSTKDFSRQHEKNIEKKIKTTLGKLTPGMIARFNYRGKDVHEPRPLVLILNPRWKNHCHAIALRVLTEAELIQLAKMVKLSVGQKIAKKVKFLRLGTKADIGNPERFYKQKIKPYMRRIDENAYRTYNTRGISNVNIIDYRFKDMDLRTSKKIKK